MKTLPAILLYLFITSVSFSQSMTPFQENGLYGYMDYEGTIVITPRYHNAGNFSEDLAPVREKGLFGYIDTTGQYIIPANFEYANEFSFGMALVYKNTEGYYIDSKGKAVFQGEYDFLSHFGDGFIAGKNSQYCITDSTGMRLSEWYDEIDQSTDKGAIVRNYYSDSLSKGRTIKYGLISDSGELVFGLGTHVIEPFGSHLLLTSNDDGQAVYTPEGKKLFDVPEKKYDFPYTDPGFFSGLAVIEIPDVDRDTIRSGAYKSKYSHYGVIDLRGNIVFENKDWLDISPFENGFAVAMDREYDHILIDSTGSEITRIEMFPLEALDGYDSHVQDGMVYIDTYDGPATMDTSGKIKYAIEYDDYYDAYRKEDIIILQDIIGEGEDEIYTLGMWIPETGTLIPPVYEMILEVEDIHNGQQVFHLKKEGNIYLINRKGQVIHKSISETSANLNIDYKRRTNYFASNPRDKDHPEFNNWANSINSYKPITPSDNFDQPGLHLLTRKKENSKSMEVFIVNNSDSTREFEGHNSYIHLTMQGKDANGKWQDIEYVPRPSCGISYHTIFLKGRHYWQFTAPVYEGSFKTKLRFALRDIRGHNLYDKVTILYSEPFEGSINPAQLWRIDSYTNSTVMDGYYTQ